MRAYRLTRPPLCPVLIGRDPYLEVLRQCCEQVRLGQGQTILLAGEAGIGKTRLAIEVKAIAAQIGFSVLQAVVSKHVAGGPYGPLFNLLRGLLNDPPPDVLRQYAAELVQILPELRPLWPEVSPSPNLDPEPARQRHVDALVQFLAQQPRPLLLVVEDIQWCDDTSLDFLLPFARRVVGQPLLLLLTYRADDAEAAAQQFVAELERTRLAVASRSPAFRRPRWRSCYAIFGSDRLAGAKLADAIQALTSGNPFFVEEALKALVAAGDIACADGTWTQKPAAELQLPGRCRTPSNATRPGYRSRYRAGVNTGGRRRAPL